ncbi:MAG: HAMP domain-containing sensor histidine kinase, partial [Bacteroidota bacterium]|nr:HAMP domain-containing sensor histidine kinase [Bacteroidota bacterium]
NRELNIKNEQITLQKDKLIEALKHLSRREKELKEANITKDKFFSIIAHDIKNPFSSILGFSNLLNDRFYDYSNEEVKKYIGIISESSENLYNLLENLLQWSRAQTNKIEFHPKKFNIAQLLMSNVALYKNTAIKKEIEIFTDFNSSIEVDADQDMADVVIRNLLSNAIKFTRKKGRIKIIAAEQKDKVEIAIIDNGVGIEKFELNKLFRIDSQIKSSGTDNEKGTGLGLHICKEFVEKNNGKIWVESEENNGSSFYFTLPKESY